VVKKIVGVIICSLLTGCSRVETNVLEGPSAGIEYHNQDTAPWPWVSVVPSARALALKNVSFEALARQLRHDMAFDPFSKPFEDVRLILLDYTILPPRIKKAKDSPERTEQYFMVASFYKIGRRPTCSPDFEVTTIISTKKGGRRELLRYMARDTIREVHVLSKSNLLTAGKKITVDLN
jgi:hypothetical protein